MHCVNRFRLLVFGRYVANLAQSIDGGGHVNAKLVVLLLRPKWFSIIELARDAQSVIRSRILIGSAKFQAT